MSIRGQIVESSFVSSGLVFFVAYRQLCLEFASQAFHGGRRDHASGAPPTPHQKVDSCVRKRCRYCACYITVGYQFDARASFPHLAYEFGMAGGTI